MSTVLRACFFASVISLIGPISPVVGSSLTGKSNEELLHIIVGGKNEFIVEEEAKIKTHLPDGFWQMPAKDAALAVLIANSDLKVKQKFQFVFDGSDATPPSHGEIGVQWTCTHCISAKNASMVLHDRGAESRLQYAIVDSFDADQAQRGHNQARSIKLPESEAHQLYEVMWWLGKIEALPVKQNESQGTEAEVERVFTTGDAHGTFSVTGLRLPKKASFRALELSEQLAGGFDADTWASCADFLLGDALERRGVNRYEPTISPPPDPEREREIRFEHEKRPNPVATEETRNWVTRMLKLLGDKKEPIRYDRIIDALVPDADPLRYSDPRIDAALFRFVRGAVNAPANGENTGKRLDGGTAARALALRGRPELFPLLMCTVRDSKVTDHVWRESAFEAAVVVAERQTRFRPEIATMVKNGREQNFDAIWRLDLREFEPELQSRATSSPDEIEITRGTDEKAPRRYHRARALLTAWNEQDALTKLKLDALIAASSDYMIRAPEFVRVEFDKLTADQQQLFRQFLDWMDQQKIHYGMWRPEYVRQTLGQ